ncbi:MAG: efflux RND transporter periplasmic adaptor subunit [Acidobacteriota bacterium]|nr:efflux RND transporter periplasmic adaptor subunit [Acidobacteriota bacterium]
MKSAFLLLCTALLSGPLFAGDAAVIRGPFEKTIVLDGKLTAHLSEKVYAPRGDTWQIQIKWMAAEGSRVEPGDPLARFDNSGILDSLQRISDELAGKYQDVARKKAEADTQEHEKRIALKTAEINHEKAKIDASIPESLLKGVEYRDHQLALIKAEKDLEKAQLALDNQIANTKSELDKLNLEIQRKEAQYQQTRARARGMEITAKTGGYVLYAMMPWEGRKIQIGDNVPATTPVLSIPDMASLEVECFAGENEATWLHPGQSARMYLDAFPDTLFTGRVIEVSNRGEVRKRWGKAPTFKVRISLDEKDLDKMRSGMSIRTEITVISKEDLLLIPLETVHLEEGAYRVKPRGKDPVTVEPVAMNAFHLALSSDGPLKEGVRLEMTGDWSGGNHED